jgi:hypothetical protein
MHQAEAGTREGREAGGDIRSPQRKLWVKRSKMHVSPERANQHEWLKEMRLMPPVFAGSCIGFDRNPTASTVGYG